MGCLKDYYKKSLNKFNKCKDCAKWFCFIQLFLAGLLLIFHAYFSYNGFMLLGLPEWAKGYEDVADPASKFIWRSASPPANSSNNSSSSTTGNAATEEKTGSCKYFCYFCYFIRFIVGITFVPIGAACWIMCWAVIFASFIYCFHVDESADTSDAPLAEASAIPVTAEPVLVSSENVRVISNDNKV